METTTATEIDGEKDLVLQVSEESEQITPLLIDAQKPRVTIFNISYPRRKREGFATESIDSEIAFLYNLSLWIWGGSKHSGLLCMALSSAIYFIMEVFIRTFPAGSIPLIQTAFTRCSFILFLSFLWLRRTGQSLFGPIHSRKFLVSRAIIGYLSLLSFIYSIQHMPLSHVTLLNFMTPMVASISARFILQEEIKLIDVTGLTCSFLGLLFIFQPILNVHGNSPDIDKFASLSSTHLIKEDHPIYAVLMGLFSCIMGGICYCLIRAGARSSESPVVTVFAFGIFATPASGLHTYLTQGFVWPNLNSLLPMVVLGTLSFFAEVFLARGLQLEKTSKVAHVQYIEAFLSQTWKIVVLGLSPLNRIFGCIIILLSFCFTVYFGHDKEAE